MVICDSPTVQNFFRQLRKKIRRRPETGDKPAFQSEITTTTKDSQPDTTTYETEEKEPPEKEPNETDLEKGDLKPCDLDVAVPYSLRTGLLVLLAFITSFIALMLVRALTPGLPSIVKFFANIYLAGTIICGKPFFDL
jgi:hypothetical protein